MMSAVYWNSPPNTYKIVKRLRFTIVRKETVINRIAVGGLTLKMKAAMSSQ